MRLEKAISNKVEATDFLLSLIEATEGVKKCRTGPAEEIDEHILNKETYPLVWLMPLRQKTIRHTGIKKVKYSFEVIILMYAKFDDNNRIRQNEIETENIANRLIANLEAEAMRSNGLVEFDEVSHVEEWEVKDHYGPGDCNGYFIPMHILVPK